jgi:hypothetical protein
MVLGILFWLLMKLEQYETIVPLYLEQSSVHRDKEGVKFSLFIYSLLKKYKIMTQKSIARKAPIWRLIEHQVEISQRFFFVYILW